MRFKILTMLVVVAMGFAACNSDRTKNGNTDSIMTDSEVMDTASMGTTSGHTMVDTVGHDTSRRDSIPPIR